MANSHFLQLCFLSIFVYGGLNQVYQSHFNSFSVRYLNETSFFIHNHSLLFGTSPVGFSFKTCHENGVLLNQVNNANDSMSIELENGTLLVTFVFPALNQTFLFHESATFSNNSWVNLYLNKTTITASSHGQVTTIAEISSEVLLKFLDERKPRKLTFGSEGSGSGFVGCIASGPYLSFNASLDDTAITLRGCPLDYKTCERDPCLDISCLNDGRCLSFDSGYACQCQSNYTGLYCEVHIGSSCAANSSQCVNGTCVDTFRPGLALCQCSSSSYGANCSHDGKNPCNSLPCFNNATCFSEDSGNFFCICRQGFVGRQCEMKADPCSSAPCRNGGECIATLDDYECLCSGSGYSGRFCEVDIDECLADPCPTSKASCFNRPGDYLCLCPPGLEGEMCDSKISFCSLDPCRNDGTCLTISSNNFVCVCNLGFTGKRCEQEIDYCAGNECNPYSETCVSEPGRYYCSCKEGFGGANCEEINECESSPCLNSASCVDLIGSFYCNCTRGYQDLYTQD